jgi:glycosyltransferase involved in cell wall biosynthesis
LKRLLLVTTQIFAPVGHREKALVQILKRHFDCRIVTLAPPRFMHADAAERSPLSLLATWVSRVARGWDGIIGEHDDIVTVARPPLPLSLKPPLIEPPLAHAIGEQLRQYRFDATMAFAPLAGSALLKAVDGRDLPIIYDDSDRYEYFYPDPVSRSYIRRKEATILRAADLVFSAGFKMGDTASAIRGKAVNILTNGIYYDRFSRIEPDFDQHPTLLYLGSFEPWMGIDRAVAALQHLPGEFSLRLIGDGRMAARLKSQTRRAGLTDRVEFTGMVKPEQVAGLMSQASIGVALYPDIPLMKNAFTLKLLEYMAAGLPVLTTGVGDASTIVELSGSGAICGHTPQEAAQAILNLTADREKLREMSERGRRFAADYDWDIVGREMVGSINKLIAGPNYS